MKNSFNELVKKRISVRKYTDREVPAGLIDKCIEAARLAPSACNSQPWKFIVVNDRALKDKLCSAAFAGKYSMNGFAKMAPVIIAVVSEKSAFLAAIGGYLRKTEYCLIDVGMACEHLVLQAAELGIGSCLLGWFDEKAVKRLLRIPAHKKIDLLISLGYFDNIVKDKDRKALDEIRSYNNYR